MTPRLRSRTILGLVAASLLAGACTPTNQITFYARTERSVPALAGKTVAVLPVMSVGPESGPAIRTARAAEQIFAAQLADVRFLDPRQTLERFRGSPDDFLAVREQVTRGLPAEFELGGTSKTLLEGDVVAGVKRDRKQQVSLASADAKDSFGPARLEPGWLDALDADYALITVPFATYRKTDQFLALYGILPFLYVSEIRRRSPQALTLLYDCKSGEKLWEAQIGVAALVEPGLASDALPVLGAAYLLTGDVENALARLLGTTSVAAAAEPAGPAAESP